jgi:hypothetical protein
MTNSALGDDTPREVAHVAHRTSQNRDLQTTVVVEMHVHRCHRQIMVVMKRPSQAFG